MRRLALLWLVPAFSLFGQTGAPAVSFGNSQRVHDLVRAGNMYLSLHDVLALVLENNLDIELQRYGAVPCG